MENHGLYVENSTGSVQIDSEYDNLLLARYGTVSTNIQITGNFSRGQYSYCVPKEVSFNTITTSAPPLVLLRAITGEIGFCKLLGSAGNWTGFSVATSLTDNGSDKYVKFYYEVYVEGGYSDVIMSGDYGLQVYTDTGRKVLDSRGQLLRVDDIQQRKLVVDNNGGSSTISSGSVSCSSSQLIDASTCGGVGIWGVPYGAGRWRLSGVYKTLLKPGSGGSNTLYLDTVAALQSSVGAGAVFGDAVKYGHWGINHVNSEDRSQTMTVIIAKEKR